MKDYKVSAVIRIALFLAVSVIFSPSLTFSADTKWYVYFRATAPTPENGTSWETAYTTIKDAITAASSGDTIIVRAETYNEYDISYGGKAITVEAEFYHKDGSLVWVEISADIQADSQGNPIGIIGVARDISNRKKAEKEKKKLEARL